MCVCVCGMCVCMCGMYVCMYVCMCVVHVRVVCVDVWWALEGWASALGYRVCSITSPLFTHHLLLTRSALPPTSLRSPHCAHRCFTDMCFHMVPEN